MSSQYPPALHVAIILSPFVLAPLAGWLGRRGGRSAMVLGLPPAILTGYFLSLAREVAAHGSFTAGIPWMPSLGLSLAFHVDGLAVFFATIVAGVGTLIVIYAVGYLGAHPQAGRFLAILYAFMGSMLGVVLSDSLIAVFVFWELTGFTSYLLIGFEHDRPEARRAALQALIVTGSGGLALLAAAVMIGQVGGTASLSGLLGSHVSLAGNGLYTGIMALVLLAAFTKSAQFPFHFWLPNAMQAPTPVSAYLHSATMVKAGIYLVARMTPILGGTPRWSTTLIVIGALTMVGGACRAVIETDLKRILAYSTIGALGVLTMLLGIGTRAAVVATLVYLLAHACYKGALFLVAGAVEHETGTRDAAALGGLRHSMRATAVAAALAATSMAGAPLFLGFIAKEQLYDTVLKDLGWPAVVLAIAASALIGAAGLIAGVSPFAGPKVPSRDIHEAPPSLWSGPLILAIVGLVAGVAPALLEAPLTLAADAVVPGAGPVRLEVWHGLTPVLLLSVLTLLGSAVLYLSRETVRRRAWPRALRTERLYTLASTTLDRLGGAIGPPLQSASLRAYVLTIVATAIVLLGSGLAVGGVLPAPSRWTPVRPHEFAVAVLVITAALSAAVARSNMMAVLSLGTVGYGVAVIYTLFGAPDLAMTQFAVETLTVVIFVLVFHHLRGFGDLSTPLVKARDGFIAAAGGTLIATLVLFIGTSGTTSRLAAYFADASPRLGHGRNIVNVMLVDFRGLDTLGEITVLVTVAVGVRALLRLGHKERRG
jgi:multicomponent Na+:H+ antiporter subunit A